MYVSGGGPTCKADFKGQGVMGGRLDHSTEGRGLQSHCTKPLLSPLAQPAHFVGRSLGDWSFGIIWNY